MIYTPFYAAPLLGPPTGTPVIDLPENIAGVVREQYKDSLIYGVGISRICAEFDENVVKSTIRDIYLEYVGPQINDLRSKVPENTGIYP